MPRPPLQDCEKCGSRHYGSATATNCPAFRKGAGAKAGAAAAGDKLSSKSVLGKKTADRDNAEASGPNIHYEDEDMAPYRLSAEASLSRIQRNIAHLERMHASGNLPPFEQKKMAELSGFADAITDADGKPSMSRDEYLDMAASLDESDREFAAYCRAMAEDMDRTRKLMSRPATGVQVANAAQVLRLPKDTAVMCVGHSSGPGRIVGVPSKVKSNHSDYITFERRNPSTGEVTESRMDVSAKDFTPIKDGFLIEHGEKGTRSYIGMQYRFCE